MAKRVKSVAGFTLIEMLITGALAAILVVVAYAALAMVTRDTDLAEKRSDAEDEMNDLLIFHVRRQFERRMIPGPLEAASFETLASTAFNQAGPSPCRDLLIRQRNTQVSPPRVETVTFQTTCSGRLMSGGKPVHPESSCPGEISRLIITRRDSANAVISEQVFPRTASSLALCFRSVGADLVAQAGLLYASPVRHTAGVLVLTSSNVSAGIEVLVQ